jgi:succinoglycan biosynthesis protein ExoA
VASRGRQASERFVFTPTLRFSHVARDSLPALWRQYELWGVFRIVTIAKRGRPGAARQLAPPVLVAVLAATLAADVVTAGRSRVGRGLLLAYAAGLAGAGAYEAVRARRQELAPLIALSLATIHLSYGAGFWTEAIRRAFARPSVLESQRDE